MNEYYVRTGSFEPFRIADARDLSAEFAAIEAAFDKLPSAALLSATNEAGLFGHYVSTLLDGVNTYAVGDVFISDQTGQMLIYKRIASGSGYELIPTQPFALESNLAADAGADMIGYKAPGAGSIATTVKDHLDRVLHQDDFASYAEAEAAAGGTRPLWCYPQTNAGLAGADTQIGLRVGHIVVGGPGDALNDVDAFVAFLAQETYANVLQEMRIGSFACRYHRAGSPDEATLGWDIRCLSATGVIDAANTEYLRGNMNPMTAEFIYDRPTTGSYAAKNTYLYATYLEVAGNVTLENVEGMVIKAPVGSQSGGGAGTIERLRGIVIENLSAYITPTIELCAIRLEGAGDAGRIWWGNSNWITADSGGKLEISCNGNGVVWKNVVTRAPTMAGFGGEFQHFIGGVARWVPYI